MQRLIIDVDAPGWAIPGVKESLRMWMERWGDMTVVDVIDLDATQDEQLRLETNSKG